MTSFTIIIGNKNYSSWSLRAWLMLKQTGVEFSEVLIPLYEPDSKETLLRHSAAAKVPVLRHGDLAVWDSLAIGEYLAELFPEAGLWPEDTGTRAWARSICAEMHSGFTALRGDMAMDMRSSFPDHVPGPGVSDDIERIQEIWNQCRVKVTDDKPFLFGAFTMADAMFAPVASRFRTYATKLDPVSEAYIDAIHAWPPMAEWAEVAETEPYTIASYTNPEG